MDFYAIDVETANERIASVCQIGIAHYQNGDIVDEWETLIDPRCEFSERNMKIHSITPDSVFGAPCIHDVYDEIYSRLNGNNIVCHGHFDRSSLLRIGEIHVFPIVKARNWLDSSRLATAVWEDFAKNSARLAYVCEKLGIKFVNHYALSDACAAAQIVAMAGETTGRNFEELCAIQYKPICVRQKKPKHAHSKQTVCNDNVNTEGEFYGETIVFTGALKRQRDEAEDLALRVGCVVGSNVTQKTTLLVIGERDVEFIPTHGMKSNKHKRAEELIAKGQPIRLLSESDFEAMISHIGK